MSIIPSIFFIRGHLVFFVIYFFILMLPLVHVTAKDMPVHITE